MHFCRMYTKKYYCHIDLQKRKKKRPNKSMETVRNLFYKREILCMKNLQALSGWSSIQVWFLLVGERVINSLQYNHQSKGNSPINMCADMALSRGLEVWFLFWSCSDLLRLIACCLSGSGGILELNAQREDSYLYVIVNGTIQGYFYV